MITLPAGTVLSSDRASFRTDRAIEIEAGARGAMVTAHEIGGTGATLWLYVRVDERGYATVQVGNDELTAQAWVTRLLVKPPLEKRAKDDKQESAA